MQSQRGRKAGIVIELIIILAGLGLLIKAAMMGAENYRFIHLAQSIQGTVTGIVNHGFTLNVQISPGGNNVIFAQDVPLLGYQLGDTVEVFFDPANPYHAAMKDFAALWFDTFMRGLAGLILLAFGFNLRAKRSL
jgi:Protein of unknown function (DUF3592)